MAKVEIDLSEFDAVRNARDKAEDELKEAQKTQEEKILEAEEKLKQAHQRKSRFSYYNRNVSTQWEEDYTKEQLKWLWENKHIEFDNPLYDLGETDNKKYIQFTKKGRRWHNWYSCSFKEYVKYYIIIDAKNYITYKLKKLK